MSQSTSSHGQLANHECIVNDSPPNRDGLTIPTVSPWRKVGGLTTVMIEAPLRWRQGRFLYAVTLPRRLWHIW
jgi:hypothetical protein